MLDYNIIKFIHIACAILIIGLSINWIFTTYLLTDHKTKEIYKVFYNLLARQIKYILYPAIIIQIFTGIYMSHIAHFVINEIWIITGYVGVALLLLCTIMIQVSLKELTNNKRLLMMFYITAIIATVVVYIMVIKPDILI